MNNNAISHLGVVDSVGRNVVHVKIVQSSACSGCKIASHCAASESKVKMIDVFTTDASDYSKGEEVNVCATTSVGLKAVAYAFVMPLLVLMACVVITYYVTDKNEGVAAIAGLASLVPSFTLLYILRGKFERIMVFTINHCHE